MTHKYHYNSPHHVNTLIDGETYWLGSTWGTYDKATDTFLTEEARVYRFLTILNHMEPAEA